jgi:hypothetical protein
MPKAASFQIRRIGTLRELLEHRLQKRPAGFGLSLGGKQGCQVGCGAQLPCMRILAPAQFPLGGTVRSVKKWGRATLCEGLLLAIASSV